MIVAVSPNGGTTYAGETPPGRLLVGTIDGVAVLERDGVGGAWRRASVGLAGQHISSLYVEPTRGGIFAGVHGSGLYRSLDGGQTWELATRGLTADHVFTVTGGQRDGAVVLYAGTEPVHLFRSTDYGDHWDELPALREMRQEHWTFPAPPHAAHTKHVAVHPAEPATLFVCVEQGGLFKSTDGGQSWRELDGFANREKDGRAYKDAHRFLLRPSDPRTAYLSGGTGFYRSEDGGETWEQVTDRSYRIAYPDALLFSPFDDHVLYMAGSSGSHGRWYDSHDANAAIACSRDGGRTWELLTTGLPEHLHGNVEAMSSYRWGSQFALFAATTDGEVFLTEDGGDHWSRLAAGLPPVSKVGHYRALMAV
jgi:photosystem II stability/assembly factor-like uncharacterized protein